jgi:hypothetical protein
MAKGGKNVKTNCLWLDVPTMSAGLWNFQTGVSYTPLYLTALSQSVKSGRISYARQNDH